jgi:hypothetical protein
MNPPLTTSSVIARTSEIITAPLGEELMMMSVAQGAYFGLDEVGAAIWSRLETPAAVGELCAALQGEFEVSPEQCEADVLSFLTSLRDAGLVNVVG